MSYKILLGAALVAAGIAPALSPASAQTASQTTVTTSSSAGTTTNVYPNDRMSYSWRNLNSRQRNEAIAEYNRRRIEENAAWRNMTAAQRAAANAQATAYFNSMPEDQRDRFVDDYYRERYVRTTGRDIDGAHYRYERREWNNPSHWNNPQAYQRYRGNSPGNWRDDARAAVGSAPNSYSSVRNDYYNHYGHSDDRARHNPRRHNRNESQTGPSNYRYND